MGSHSHLPSIPFGRCFNLGECTLRPYNLFVPMSKCLPDYVPTQDIPFVRFMTTGGSDRAAGSRHYVGRLDQIMSDRPSNGFQRPACAPGPLIILFHSIALIHCPQNHCRSATCRPSRKQWPTVGLSRRYYKGVIIKRTTEHLIRDFPIIGQYAFVG